MARSSSLVAVRIKGKASSIYKGCFGPVYLIKTKGIKLERKGPPVLVSKRRNGDREIEMSGEED